MPFIPWEDQFNTGISVLDDQHREILRNLNQLYEEFTAHGDLEAAVRRLDFLMAYMTLHFQTEEALLASKGFPDLQAHEAAHALLSRKVMDLRMRMGTPTPPGTVDLLKFIGDWLAHHLVEVDQEYVRFFQAHETARV